MRTAVRPKCFFFRCFSLVFFFSSNQTKTSPTPCQLVRFSPCGVHSCSDCLRARAPIIDQLPVVVAHSRSVPGRLNRFVRSSLRVNFKCVGLALFMQAWSFALRTSCRSTWLVSILGRADRSCDSNYSVQSGQTILPEAQRGTLAEPLVIVCLALDFAHAHSLRPAAASNRLSTTCILQNDRLQLDLIHHQCHRLLRLVHVKCSSAALQQRLLY